MYKVLIVDDEPFILGGLPDLIEWGEHNLEIAGLVKNGEEALKVLTGKTTIHIVLTDIRMPRMDGLELIRRVRELGHNVKFIVLSGYNDFEYVKQAAKLGIENYLLKPVDDKELTQTMFETIRKIESEQSRSIEIRQGLQVLRDNVLYSWVSGEIADRELKEKATMLGIDITGNAYTVAIVSILTVPPSFESDRSRLQFAVRNICSDTLEGKLSSTPFYNLDGGLIIIIANSNKREVIEEGLHACMANIISLLKADVFITVGNFIPDYRNLYKSYGQAQKILAYSMILGKNQLLFFDTVPVPLPRKQFDLQMYFIDIGSALKTGSLEAAADTVDRMFDELKRIPGLTPAFIRNTALETFFVLNAAVRSSRSIDAASEDMSDMLVTINELYIMEEMKRWLHKITATAMAKLSERNAKLSPQIVKVVDDILIHYAEGINLKTSAAKFEVNAYYLGQLFRKETGKSFTEYLNTVRIEKAKELLLAGTMRTNDIAIKVGYINTHYFFTVFKKMNGMSPTEFRGEL
jgi:two-component system response regulator YesN